MFGLKHRAGHSEVNRLSLPDGGGSIVKPLLELQDGLVKLSILKMENVEFYPAAVAWLLRLIGCSRSYKT